MLLGKTIHEINIGDKAEYSRTVTETDVVMFGGISGDLNPAHFNEEYSKDTFFKGRIAHGMLTAGYISTVLGMQLPGPGTIYLSQELQFTAPVRFGDTITATVEALEKNIEKNKVTFETICKNQHDVVVLKGKAIVKPRK
ncbi:MaoC family dehydratase [Clostridium carnis]